MRFYISQTALTLTDGAISATETVLTKPDTERATREMYRRMERIGVPHIHVCEHPANSRRHGQLLRAQNKRHKAARDLTGAEVAEILGADLTSS